MGGGAGNQVKNKKVKIVDLNLTILVTTLYKNTLIKSQRLSDRIRKQDPANHCLQEI